MCLSVPAKIIKLLDEPPHSRARFDQMGNILEADVSLIENPRIGDYLLIHAGIAIDRYAPEAARETLDLFKEIGELQKGRVPGPGTRDAKKRRKNPHE